jgi:hypothetical protein
VAKNKVCLCLSPYLTFSSPSPPPPPSLSVYVAEEVMSHIAKITGELLEANQQRDAVVRELKLVKELAAASQVCACVCVCARACM